MELCILKQIQNLCMVILLDCFMEKDMRSLYAHHDIYKNEYSPKEVTGIQTFYEKQYLEKGKPITYIQFKIK